MKRSRSGKELSSTKKPSMDDSDFQGPASGSARPAENRQPDDGVDDSSDDNATHDDVGDKGSSVAPQPLPDPLQKSEDRGAGHQQLPTQGVTPGQNTRPMQQGAMQQAPGQGRGTPGQNTRHAQQGQGQQGQKLQSPEQLRAQRPVDPSAQHPRNPDVAPEEPFCGFPAIAQPTSTRPSQSGQFYLPSMVQGQNILLFAPAEPHGPVPVGSHLVRFWYHHPVFRVYVFRAEAGGWWKPLIVLVGISGEIVLPPFPGA